MDRTTFIFRLVTKRPVYFHGPFDLSMLRNGQTPPSLHWRAVGSDEEESITLDEYLSYDEMAVSALLAISSHTRFINSGSRGNISRSFGRLAERCHDGHPSCVCEPCFTETGVFVGLVGPRFEKPGFMEAQHCLVSGALPFPRSHYIPI